MAVDVTSVVGIGPLDNVIFLLQQFGFFRVVLPFLLVFAIFYAVLIKTGILGKATDGTPTPIARNTSAIIGFVAAFFVIAYTPVVDALAVLIPQASFLLVVALLVIMLITFVFPSIGSADAKPWVWGIFILIILGIFVAIVGTSVGENIPVLNTVSKALAGGIDLDAEQISFFVGLIIVLGVPLLIIYMLTRTPPTTPHRWSLMAEPGSGTGGGGAG